MSEVDYEGEARVEGWRPREEWTGDPDAWVDAKEFVERGKQIASFQRKKITRLEDRISGYENEMREMKEFRERENKRQKEDFERHIAELEAQRSQAVDEGDGATFTQTDRQINDMRASQAEQRPPDQQVYQKMADDWQRSNDWYGTDNRMTYYADGIAEKIAQEGFSGQAFFSELERRVEKEFPENFSPQGRSPVGAPGLSEPPAGAGTGRGYEDLPPEDKEACDRICKRYEISREEWLDQYDWDQ